MSGKVREASPLSKLSHEAVCECIGGCGGSITIQLVPESLGSRLPYNPDATLDTEINNSQRLY